MQDILPSFGSSSLKHFCRPPQACPSVSVKKTHVQQRLCSDRLPHPSGCSRGELHAACGAGQEEGHSHFVVRSAVARNQTSGTDELSQPHAQRLAI